MKDITKFKIGEVQEITRILLGGLREYNLTEVDVRTVINKKIANHPNYIKQRRQVNAKVKQIMVDPAERIRRLCALLETVLKYPAGDITRIKENAFYVDRENGALIYPDPKQDYDLLAWMLTFTVITKEWLLKQESSIEELYRFMSRDQHIKRAMDRITERLD
ncbi:MAG: hypothetical protein M1129_03540 [Candidatus Thermoplasmatota archaeon]|nr:hypothetical protein [Candidatus Thermoplasmatota archaeon]